MPNNSCTVILNGHGFYTSTKVINLGRSNINYNINKPNKNSKIFMHEFPLVTGTRTIAEHPINARYKDRLSDTLINKCNEFSTLCFALIQGFDNLNDKRSLLKHKSEELKNLAVSDSQSKEVFISYLEELISRSSNYEFLIPYYDICNESDHVIASNISSHHKNHFGLLGTVDDILGS